MKPLIPILTLVVAMPAGLRAQAGDPTGRIDAALAHAEAAGVPIQLLRLKQAEGKAKGVLADRLADGLEKRAAALILARGAMPESDAHAIAAGADAVEMGIGPDVLAHVEATVPTERRFVAVFALTRLVQLGHGPARAMREVENALLRGPHALPDLAARADRARARHGSGDLGPTFLPDVPPGGIPGPGLRGGGRPVAPPGPRGGG